MNLWVDYPSFLMILAPVICSGNSVHDCRLRAYSNGRLSKLVLCSPCVDVQTAQTATSSLDGAVQRWNRFESRERHPLPLSRATTTPIDVTNTMFACFVACSSVPTDSRNFFFVISGHVSCNGWM